MRVVEYLTDRVLALQSQIRELSSDISGFAAVEFALIAPVMIVMLLGCVEVSDASTVEVKMIDISASVSDMVSRCSNVTTDDLNDLMRLSDAMIGRYPAEPLYIEIIELNSDANGKLTVGWSYDRNHASPLPAGSTYRNVPPGLVPANGSLVVAKAVYNYTSPIGHYIHGVVPLQHTSYNAPYNGSAIPAPGATKC